MLSSVQHVYRIRGTMREETVERMKTIRLATSSTATTDVCLDSSPYHLVFCRNVSDDN